MTIGGCGRRLAEVPLQSSRRGAEGRRDLDDLETLGYQI